jgi:hypothetical protein
VVVLLTGYACIAFTYTLNDEIVPIWASTPTQHNGLALDSNRLGIPLSIGGVALMFVAIVVYPQVQRRIGNFTCTRLGLASMVGIAFLYPCCSLIAQHADVSHQRGAFVFFTLITCVRNVSANFAFTGSMVMVRVIAACRHCL